MNSDMIIKVCGMRDPDNIELLGRIGIQWMGMIFYTQSKRHFAEHLNPIQSTNLKKVGVFVNANEHYILDKDHIHDLDLIQLHGEESPEFCRLIQSGKRQVIKAFSIDPTFDFNDCSPYAGTVDYFLFDTKGIQPGGNGIRFDWDLLAQYKGPVPFLLAGGIGPDHVQLLRDFDHPFWAGIDLNSQFEKEPGLKDIHKLKKFRNELFS